MSIRIEGLEKLQRQLKEAEAALKTLDGTIATVKFDPSDPQSVQSAIKEMERAVDSRTAGYGSNPLVANLGQQMKDNYRKRLLQRARAGQ